MRGGSRPLRAAVLLVSGLAATPALAGSQPVRARHGMVVSQSALASQVGADVLQAGGGALDAAVATAFALAVTYPMAGNIGGGGFLLYRPAAGEPAAYDFRETAPAAATPTMFLKDGRYDKDLHHEGYLSVGVPGTVAGLHLAWKEHGRLSWRRLVEPAIVLARGGFVVTDGLSRSLRDALPKMTKYPATLAQFSRDGTPYEMGDVLKQPDLARTLQRIAALGPAGFYEGETAKLLAKDMAAHGGHITENDMRRYAVRELKPLSGSYHGYTILSAPPPSSGGVGVLQMLGMLDTTGYEKGGAGSAIVVHYMTEAMRRYFADRSENLGDPDFFKVPLTSLLDPKYIAKQRASINPERATPSSAIKAAVFNGKESNETTHYTVADSDGNVVCVTYTLNGGFGSKVTATGLGFLLNNEMDDFAPKPGEANMYGLIQGEANAIAPGKTPLSSMTPTIVLKDGKPLLALGSPGGPTIINSVLEVLVNVLDFGMNVQDAVNWPRFHHQWLPDELRMEPGFSPDTVALLEKRGYTVKRAGEQGRPYGQGEVSAIRFGANGWLEGAADPRTEGTAEGH